MFKKEIIVATDSDKAGQRIRKRIHSLGIEGIENEDIENAKKYMLHRKIKSKNMEIF